MQTIVWKGSHGNEIYELIKETYFSVDRLLIICPPRFESLEMFLPFLPTSEIIFRGELSSLKNIEHTSSQEYEECPKFGLFSSGTSDENNKLLLYTNQNLDSSNDGIMSFFKDLNINTIYSYPQPYHIFGLSLGYILSINRNFELITKDGKYSRESHALWENTALKNGENILTLGTPTHFEDLCKHSKLHEIKSLTCIIGGAIVTQKLWDKVKTQLNILYPSIGYGSSEASPGITHLKPGVRPKGNNSIGELLPNMKLTFTENEILINGENICLATINKNGIHFYNGKYLLPDIIEQVDDESFLYIGRNDFIINRGGEKFSLEEVEAKLLRYFDEPIVVTYKYCARLGQELCFILRENTKIKSNIIFEFMSETYSRTFDSNNIYKVERFPMNENLKLDRNACSSYFKEDKDV